jgi:sugar-specific transcriptional regulator TrmB
VERLTRYLGLSEAEARTYIAALKQGSISEGETKSLLARGMLIISSNEKVYLPVHPRLALSNLYRSRPDRTTPEMREKRKLIDKLTLELIPAYDAKRRSPG